MTLRGDAPIDERKPRPQGAMLGARLGRTRAATFAAMTAERLWPLLVPLVAVMSLFLCAAWFGVFRLLPDWARIALAVAFGLAVLAALLPLARLRIPRAAEVDRRIERTNRLAHAPVSAQTDRLAGREDAFSAALWREHQRRLAEGLGTLGADLPHARLPERDPLALRAVPALLLVIGFAFSFGPFGGGVADAFRPAPGPGLPPPRVDAWVTPPAYTGRAPVFLTGETQAADASAPGPAATAERGARVVAVPEGSVVTLRVTGGSGEETLSLTGADGLTRDIAPAAAATAMAPAPVAARSSTARQFTATLDRDGLLALRSGAREIGSWAFAVTPDKPPTIRFADEPKRAVNGALELAYEIEDDYGAASATAAFALAEPQAPGARPLYGPPEMPLVLPRRGKGPAAKATRDLTEHVWAGAKVSLTLAATDDAGQAARSETKTFLLPERTFTNPLARAVVEQRRILALDANRKGRVLDLLDAITLRPEDTFSTMSHYLALVSARTRLKMAESDDQLREVVSYLWEIALGIEDGDLSAAEKRLRQAQEALKQALENGAGDEEIEKLMKELREAMNEFLREFAERAQQNPNFAEQMSRPGQEMRQSDLERMLDQIENLAKSGSRDKAQELLSQLQDMMNNLQAGRRQQQGRGGEQNTEMRQQMDRLGEIMRRQQEMMNDTFRMDQMQRGQRQRGQDRSEQRGDQGRPGEGRQGQGRQMTPEEFADALRQLQQGQGRLRQDLEALTKSLEGLGIQPGEGFGEAGEAMGQAEGALGQGEGDRAAGEQGRALEALRRGAQDMMQQMQQAMEGDDGGGQEGGRQQNAGRDPLGRPRATTGPDFGNSVKVPDEIDVQRARQILEAIRKRLGNALSPELERSYLERLLDLR